MRMGEKKYLFLVHFIVLKFGVTSSKSEKEKKKIHYLIFFDRKDSTFTSNK